MTEDRKRTVDAGVLIVIGMVAGVLSIVPVVDGPDCLLECSAYTGQVFAGATFQLVLAATYVGFALHLYPILRRFNESLAFGFFGLRLVAVAFHLLAVVCLPLFVVLSQLYIQAGAPEASYFQTIGEMLRSSRDLLNHGAMILALCFSGAMFYLLVFRARLVPRWLSVWGLTGTVFSAVASLLFMFHLIDVIAPVYLVMNLPLAVAELVLAIFLISKGFNSVAPPDDV